MNKFMKIKPLLLINIFILFSIVLSAQKYDQGTFYDFKLEYKIIDSSLYLKEENKRFIDPIIKSRLKKVILDKDKFYEVYEENGEVKMLSIADNYDKISFKVYNEFLNIDLYTTILYVEKNEINYYNSRDTLINNIECLIVKKDAWYRDNFELIIPKNYNGDVFPAIGIIYNFPGFYGKKIFSKFSRKSEDILFLLNKEKFYIYSYDLKYTEEDLLDKINIFKHKEGYDKFIGLAKENVILPIEFKELDIPEISNLFLVKKITTEKINRSYNREILIPKEKYLRLLLKFDLISIFGIDFLNECLDDSYMNIAESIAEYEDKNGRSNIYNHLEQLRSSYRNFFSDWRSYKDIDFGSQAGKQSSQKNQLSYDFESIKKQLTEKRINESYKFYTGERKYILVKNDKPLLPIHFNFEVPQNQEFQLAIVNYKDSHGLYDCKNERWVTTCNANTAYIIYTNNSHYFLLSFDDFEDKVYDKYGHLLLSNDYEEINNFYDNIKVLYVKDRANRKYAIYDLDTKKFLTPFKFSKVETVDIGELLIFVDEYDRYLYNVTLDKIYPTKYRFIKKINSEPIFEVVTWLGEKYHVNKYNQVVEKQDLKKEIIPESDFFQISLGQIEYDDRIYRNKKGKYGLKDKSGKIKIPFDYDMAVGFSGNVLVRKGKKYGLFRPKRNDSRDIDYILEVPVQNELTFISPVSYYFENKKKRKYYRYEKEIITNQPINSFKEIIMTCSIYKSKDVMSFEIDKGKHYFISEGKMLNEVPFEDVDKVHQYYLSHRDRSCYEYIKAKRNGKWAIVDNNTNPMTPFIFDEIIENIASILVVKFNGKYALYNMNVNKFMTKPIFDDIITEREGEIVLRIGNQFSKENLGLEYSGAIEIAPEEAPDSNPFNKD